jgi:hypothetical protein
MAEYVTLSGPFFESRARAMAGILAELEKDVADEGKAMVRSHLVAFIRKPTPYYWTRLEVRKYPGGPGLSIWDNYIIYGPWLEGVGSRNFPNTRFKGYAAFRTQAGILERRAGEIGNRSLQRTIKKLN